MGLFDFIKGAGERIWGDDEAEKAQAKADQRAADRRVGAKLVELVNGLGLDVKDLSIRFENGVATVSGTAKSQSDREKVVLMIGNTQGVSQVDDRLEVVEPEPEAKFYTVKSGDTLSKIAKEFYGDAMKYPVIFEANKPMLKDPNLIYPNQVLRIPNID